MRRQQIRKALDEYADKGLRAQPDLWPAIRQRALGREPRAGRIYIEPAGRRMSLLAPAALIAVLVVAVVVAPLLWPGNGPTPQGTPPPSPSGVAATASSDSNAYYANLFTSKLAAHLGVDPAQLNSAFAEAVNSTAAQAVQDGALTPDEATQAKAGTSQGLGFFLFHGLTVAGAGAAKGGDPSIDQWFVTPTP